MGDQDPAELFELTERLGEGWEDFVVVDNEFVRKHPAILKNRAKQKPELGSLCISEFSLSLIIRL